VSGEGGEVVTR